MLVLISTTVFVFGCEEIEDSVLGIDADAMSIVQDNCKSVAQCESMYNGLDIAACNQTNGICRCWEGGSKIRCQDIADPDTGVDTGVDTGNGNMLTIPGKIEAETYSSQSGIQTQNTSDAGGGQNVGWTTTGDWMDYNVNIKTAGQYTVKFRVASASNIIKFDLKNGNNVLGSISRATTGGWQTWVTVTKTVQLPQGNNTLRVLVTGGGWNFNWMDFAVDTGVDTDVDTGVDTDVPANSWRIGYSADGNQHDADDWHASPMSLALLHAAGQKDKLVHFDYNNHLGNNNTSKATTHKNNVNAIKNKVGGWKSGIFFDDQENVNGAVQNIANQINASTADNRFYLICAGPMEVCWRGIDAAQDAKEKYVTVISHSSWNDNHDDTNQMNHTWNSISNDFECEMHHINDQNPPAFKSNCSDWNWLKDISSFGQTLYNVVCTGDKAGDASDAGMMHYLLTGKAPGGNLDKNHNPTMNQVKSFLQ